MNLSLMKHLFFGAAAVFCTLLLSGCIAMVLERPLSEANEFRDENLEGTWMTAEKDGSKSKDTFVLAIKRVEKHYTLSWMLPNKVTFTVTQIPDGKSGSYRFASIVFDDPENPKNVSCMLVRYTSSPDEIGVYNVTKALQDQEDYKKLCKDPARKDLVTAGPDEVRKWCAAHAEEMELIFVLKRCRFKTDADRWKFLHLSEFYPEHVRRVAVILSASKDSGTQLTPEQRKKIAAELEAVKKWVSGSKEMISPELAAIFEQYVSTPLNGRSGKEVLHELDVYTQLIRKIAYLQLLN